MKFYVIKPKKENINVRMIQGILEMYPDAELADTIEECDQVILQPGNWTRSRICCADYNKATKLHKNVSFGSVYLDKFVVVLNNTVDFAAEK